MRLTRDDISAPHHLKLAKAILSNYFRREMSANDPRRTSPRCPFQNTRVNLYDVYVVNGRGGNETARVYCSSVRGVGFVANSGACTARPITDHRFLWLQY